MSVLDECKHDVSKLVFSCGSITDFCHFDDDVDTGLTDTPVSLSGLFLVEFEEPITEEAR